MKYHRQVPALLLSLLFHAGVVAAVGTVLTREPFVVERIEVDLQAAPPPREQLPRPPRASEAPAAPRAVPVPRPAAVPRRLTVAPTTVPAAPRPSVAPAPPESSVAPLPPPALAAVPPVAAESAPPPRPPQPPPEPARPAEEVLAAYYAAVRSKIEAAKRYPPWARRRGVEGTVTVAFALEADGSLGATQVIRSSGSSVLEKAALAAVGAAAPYPSLPGGAQQESLTITLVFALR